MRNKYLCFGIVTTITLFLFTSCFFSHTHDSNVSCDITIDNEYIIKWDIFPKAVGKVSVYISDTPDNFNTRKPIAVVDADDGVVSFPTPDPNKRHYFLLDFNGCFSRIVAARASCIQSAYDFRDLGGYTGVANKRTKWGMIYRTGPLDTLSEADIERIKNIAPKTIVEFSNKGRSKCATTDLGAKQVISLSSQTFNVDSLIEKIYKGDFSRDEARIVINKYYLSLLESNSKENFKQLFDILSDEENYPILLSSNYGKGFNDIASLFILVSLGVNKHEISEDYTWANKYFCHTRIMQKISHLPEEVREAIVSIIHNNQRDLSNVINTLQNQHESIDKYLIDSLNLTLDKRRQIHNILLVDEEKL